MKSIVKAVVFITVAAGLVSGCGSSGGGSSAGVATSSPSSSAPSAAVDGAALYTANCATCHGPLATSAKRGVAASAILSRMYTTPYATRTLTAVEVQAIADALAVTAPTTTTTPPPPPATTVDGAALYTANCATCHGPLATSAKRGVAASAILSRMYTTPYATRTLTAAEVQAIADALAVTAPPTTTIPPPPPATTVDGAALYAANCATCHGPLATSAKRGVAASAILSRMYTTPYATRTLTAAEVQAIADALAVTAPPTTTTPPPPPATAACGSCHAIPPATGKHAFHTSQGVGCATCHGSGYSTTTFNAATHNNGTKNLTTTIGWTSTTRSCSNSCHGKKSW